MISFPLGRYPTPVTRLQGLPRQAGAKTTLWVKHDDLTHPEYGGNKVRKLEAPLLAALRAGAKRVVTVGAVGSHHVLATAFFARKLGLEVDAVLVAQPKTSGAEAIARASLGCGIRAIPAGSMAMGFFSLLAHAAQDGFVIPVGGSSTLGTLGYVEAAYELAEQIRSGEVPRPDRVVVTFGSGGTAAGLALGFAAAGLDVPVVGVAVSDPVIVVRGLVTWLMVQAAAIAANDPRSRIKSPGALAHLAQQRLTVTTDYLGLGYAHPTEAGMRAVEIGAAAGLGLEPTYTGKTFAAVMDEMASERATNLLYWHTLSSAPFEPLLEHAPKTLPPELARLLR